LHGAENQRLADTGDTEEVRRGDAGYWEHWWTMLHDASTQENGRLAMDMVVPVGGAFPERRWHDEIDRGVRDYALDGPRICGRVIVPPASIGSAAEPLIEMALEHGFEIRVLPSDSRFAVYNGVAAVLTDPASTDPANADAHLIVRNPAMVTALMQLFELQWAAALPWRQRTGGAGRVLELLAQGWTDERIAAELGLSPRTVNRRVAELMRTTGAQSRFALGMRAARAGLG